MARLQGEVAAAGTRAASEMTRRRRADAVATAYPDLVCPISHALMTDPVVAADGHSYERRQIQRWISTNPAHVK